MDKIQEQVDGVEEEASIVKDLYDLMDNYQVPLPPEDLAVYQVRTSPAKKPLIELSLSVHQSLRPEVMRLRSAVDKAVSDREKYVDKFCNHLDRDIVELGKEVKEIKNQSQVLNSP